MLNLQKQVLIPTFENIECTGKACQTWFPPMLGTTPFDTVVMSDTTQGITTNSLYVPQMMCSGSITQEDWNNPDLYDMAATSGVVTDGNVTYTFPLYKPLVIPPSLLRLQIIHTFLIRVSMVALFIIVVRSKVYYN